MITDGYYVLSFLGRELDGRIPPREDRGERTSMKFDRQSDAQAEWHSLCAEMPYTAAARWCHMVCEVLRPPRPGEYGYEGYMDDMLVDQSY